jgi:hypothetical protein
MPSPSRWTDRLLGFAFTILAVAVALYVAARLIVAVLPVLIGLAVVGAVAYAWLVGLPILEGWVVSVFS